jgi:acyl transferase domain-containing protein
MLIEDAPVRCTKGVDPRTVHVVTVSAKTPFSFKENAKHLLAYITKHSESPIGDISYTTTARRMHHMFRAGFAVTSSAELKYSLEELVASTAAPIKTSSVDVAFVFTGQGSHYLRMGKELFDNCSTFRRDILDYDNICQTQSLPSFKAVIDGSGKSLETLSPIQIQLALIALELALANLWLSFGVKPALVIGHSLGEYAALCVAGVLSVNDALFLVGKRASLMTNLCSQGTHAMLAVMLEAAVVEKDLLESNTSCEIACFNGPRSTVIGGRVSEISLLKTFYESKGVKATKLETSLAFHSSQLEPILEDFQIVAKSVPFCKPTIPVASTLLGRIVEQEGVFTAEYLCRHTRDPVKFLNALEACRTTGIVDEQTLWLEIGPNAVCLSAVKSVLNVPEPFALRTLKKEESSSVSIAKCIAKVYASGVQVNWMAYQKEYESTHRLLVLPSYAFDMKNYWIQYEGDWCLRKNMASSPTLAQESVVTAFGTTSLQRIQSEHFDSNGASVVFVSDISEPKLRDTIQGHLVDKTAVCPASVYSDMAFTAAKYIHNHYNRSGSSVAMDVMNMKIIQPLIQNNDLDKQLVYVIATRQANSDTVELTFNSEEVGKSQTSVIFILAIGRIIHSYYSL